MKIVGDVWCHYLHFPEIHAFFPGIIFSFHFLDCHLSKQDSITMLWSTLSLPGKHLEQ